MAVAVTGDSPGTVTTQLSSVPSSAADALYSPHRLHIANESVLKLTITLADLGFFIGGDFGNPSEPSEQALRGSGLTRE